MCTHVVECPLACGGFIAHRSVAAHIADECVNTVLQCTAHIGLVRCGITRRRQSMETHTTNCALAIFQERMAHVQSTVTAQRHHITLLEAVGADQSALLASQRESITQRDQRIVECEARVRDRDALASRMRFVQFEQLSLQQRLESVEQRQTEQAQQQRQQSDAAQAALIRSIDAHNAHIIRMCKQPSTKHPTLSSCVCVE